ncbi:hypothetical protein SUGI_0041030 [Cryptomeria japonica]|uniref:V-type proton ATPase subunit E-like n=1 Tax=Cryptomeria japonica TaxID=3369 RepID=UPI002408A1BD|nr:V-type proton ATPase subunit E-like [Cryptomeria japonica]GLJ06526.1 hypothetical protein SUGI_0041030 [Cryptomeria japonica]
MKEADFTKQIQRLVNFILKEAEDISIEMGVSSEQEYHSVKSQLIQSGIDKINQEYERKEKHLKIRQKIEYSKHLNSSRLQILQAQDDLISGMKQQVKKELVGIIQDNRLYKKLLKDLILQALFRLNEPAVILRCREDEWLMVESVIEEAKQEYSEREKIDEIVLDHKFFLPPAHGPDLCCSGGIVMASKNGQIVCDNTVDKRLDIVFAQKLPEIFGHSSV